MPMQHYQRDLARPDFRHDAAQENAVRQLQRVADELVARYEAVKKSRGLGRLVAQKQMKQPVQGLYMWGGVGRGKTYLMDIFFEALPFRRKQRIHFHRFMQRVHKELNALRGTQNPLDIVADTLFDESVVICFDEFFVTDITDAMLLGGLFEKLFARGVTLIATSNIVPDRLYENGLQRERFLPAIALLKQHCDVINVDSGVDYRLRVLEKAELYHWPLDEGAETSLSQSFGELTSGLHVECHPIIINDRHIDVTACTDDVLWTTFAELCVAARSASDYIELAREYHTVLLARVPQMDDQLNDAARRFINLVDEFYDRNVNLIVSAAVPIHELYVGSKLAFEFQRTQSRLLEMQSREYLAREHRP
ncbi:MAG: cell division protein ZapE [Moraxellaceae bacterium]|nr:cell division protein ZapE [Moraxellaceae bacterium]